MGGCLKRFFSGVLSKIGDLLTRNTLIAGPREGLGGGGGTASKAEKICQSKIVSYIQKHNKTVVPKMKTT